nr:hypothetical protein [Pelagibacterales bacterium]
MKKILLTTILTLFLTSNSFADILFRVVCDSPKGKMLSHQIIKPDNKEIFTEFDDDQYSDDDKIELIYDSSKPNYIQFIWGGTNEIKQIAGRNGGIFHWRFFDKNYANGFYWSDWNFSLSNLMLIH